MSEKRVPTMIVIRADTTELEDDLDEIDAKQMKSELAVVETTRKSMELQRIVDEQAQNIEIQMQTSLTLVSTTFGVVRNLLTIFGASLDAVQVAMLQTMETIIRTFITTTEAIRLARLGTLGPLGAALAVAEVVSTVSATMMLVAAQQEAKQQFALISTKVDAAQNALRLTFS